MKAIGHLIPGVHGAFMFWTVSSVARKESSNANTKAPDLSRGEDIAASMPTGAREITLRFLAAPADITFGGTVHAGRILEWIDKAAYTCAVGWSGRYCVTAYVGNIRFSRPVAIGHLVEVRAQLIHTGRTSMHMLVSVSSADPKDGVFARTTECLTIFVAIDDTGRSTEVPRWEPACEEDRILELSAIGRIQLRKEIEEEMARQTYTAPTVAREVTMRFLATPADVNWGGKVHGGTAMRWIDDAAYVCAVGWTRRNCAAVYAGGVRFYAPLVIGNLVELQARLLYTTRIDMHIAVHVRSADPKVGQWSLTTHSLMVFASLDNEGKPASVPPWKPVSAEDIQLEQHAIRLMQLRSRVR